MADLAEMIGKDLADYYRMVREQTHQWVDPLTDEQLWLRPFAHGNSVGHLLLHMTGNLSYYIGARVAENGYVRDRNREFTEPEHKPKADLLAAFDRAIALVIATIEEQSAEDRTSRSRVGNRGLGFCVRIACGALAFFSARNGFRTRRRISHGLVAGRRGPVETGDNFPPLDRMG